MLTINIYWETFNVKDIVHKHLKHLFFLSHSAPHQVEIRTQIACSVRIQRQTKTSQLSIWFIYTQSTQCFCGTLITPIAGPALFFVVMDHISPSM